MRLPSPPQLYWAQLHSLRKEELLFAFGRHYRDLSPDGTSHQNIRTIIAAPDLSNIRFPDDPPALLPKCDALPAWAVTATMDVEVIAVNEG